MNKIKNMLYGCIATTLVACGASAQNQSIDGLVCESPPPQHCPDKDCPGELVIATGEVVDPDTERKFFLDYPCDWKPGEPLTFVLNLHGGGSYGNWQRHYFPAFDYVDEYNLVVATPHSPRRVWTPGDDEHLQNIVNMVYGHFGEDNLRAFWLAGHSQGGQTSNRLLVEHDWVKERLTGWVSLSGGRLGTPRPEVRAPIPRAEGAGPPPRPPASDSDSDSDKPSRIGAGGAYPAERLPDYAFTHIYSSGEHELPSSGLPDSSPYAEKLGCNARVKQPDIVDTKGGYVYDSSRTGDARNKIWGLDPGPGRAEVYVYPDCDNGDIVADIIRMDKGHTEGLEPAVTEAIIKMMVAIDP